MKPLDLAFALPDPAHWRALATTAHLALLLDLDGTLVEFAATPEQAVPDAETLARVQAATDAGVQVVIVSGRKRSAIEPLVERLQGAWWFAEHGAWQYLRGGWSGPGESAPELDELVAALAALAEVPGARYERKSLSVCIHWRGVEGAQRAALIAAAELACDEWLESHDDFERLPGVDHFEVRRRAITKGLAVRCVRDASPSTRIIAIGDDVTDEDMFSELVDGDAGIAVGHHCRRTQAHATLSNPTAVRDFLRWLVGTRDGSVQTPPPVGPIMDLRPARERTLVVMSNRTPSVTVGRQREVGGLVSALEPALRDGRGIWLGWSGHEREGKAALAIDAFAEPARASFDFTRTLRERFYGGFCNRVLWPLFHSFPMRVSYEDADWEAYVAANEAYAQHALDLAQPGATIWVHDYHLLLVARALRRRGHTGPIGMFLHIPFPPRELFESMPWHAELLEAMLDFDLVGFHTERWAESFLDVMRHQPQVRIDGRTVRAGTRCCHVGVFPIAIDADAFTEAAEEAPDVAGLRAALGDRTLLLGVDRLDYSKGIPQRLAGFERMLERYPAWRGRVCLVQVSVPSRAEIPDYSELRHTVETLVGRINGKYGEADWVPVRYLYRSYDHAVLAQLYRLAKVAVVTPLRDGMNLVAKEFVASQDAGDPGVLVLSRFAGAAVQLRDAILTNPFHADGMAADLDRALQMPAAERVARHARLRAVIDRESPQAWSAAFLDALAVAATRRDAAPEPLRLRHVRAVERDRLS